MNDPATPTYHRLIQTFPTQTEAWVHVMTLRAQGVRNADVADVRHERPQIKTVNRWAVVERRAA